VNEKERQGAPVDLVKSDSQLTCRMISDVLDMGNKTVAKISLHELGMQKLAVKLKQRNLTEEEKDISFRAQTHRITSRR
jgi:hypothetical protein